MTQNLTSDSTESLQLTEMPDYPSHLSTKIKKKTQIENSQKRINCINLIYTIAFKKNYQFILMF